MTREDTEALLDASIETEMPALLDGVLENCAFALPPAHDARMVEKQRRG